MRRNPLIVAALTTICLAWFGSFAILHHYLGIEGGAPVSAVFATLFSFVFVVATLRNLPSRHQKSVGFQVFPTYFDLPLGGYETLSDARYGSDWLVLVAEREDGGTLNAPVLIRHTTQLPQTFAIEEGRRLVPIS